MARLRLPIAMSLVALAPTESLAFVTTAKPVLFPGRVQLALGDPHCRHVPLRRKCCGRRHVLRASVKPDVGDIGSVISEMEDWAHAITPETNGKRSSNYVVSTGTTLPEVFFDFWKAVSCLIDEHRATSETRSFQKLIMFVAPFCEELKDYETMEHAHQLFQQSANDGGCDDFGQNFIFGPYHPNFRHRPRPKDARMASRHTPHPAFSIHAIYMAGGRKSLTSLRASTENPGTGNATHRSGFPGSSVPLMESGEEDEGMGNKRKRRGREWAASTRSSLEAAYKMAASYGAEDKVVGSSGDRQQQRQHLLAGKGVPESSLEIMQNTQEWLKGVLKDAAESDAAAAMQLKMAGAGKSTSPHSTASFNPLPSGAGGSQHPAAHGGGRFSAFKPPTAAEAAAAVAAAAAEEEEAEAASGGALAANLMSSQEITPRNRPAAPRFTAAAGGLKHAFTQAAERVTVREEDRRGGVVKEQEEANEQKQEETVVVGTGKEGEGAWEGGSAGGVFMPGKELVKRMKDISQYIVARSETPEEAYGDAWEVIMEMAGRAASRGCSVPTEDYSSSSAPCYGALLVTPDLATYSSDAFFRFKDTLNRGLKHLPMEHDISVEAFHPETVSDASPLDHRFTRSPFPTLHICYHGLRTQGTAFNPKARRSTTTSSVSSAASSDTSSSSSGSSSSGCSGGIGGVAGEDESEKNDYKGEE